MQNNGDLIYTANICNTSNVNESYLCYTSTNLGEILDRGSSYDVAVKKARFPVTSIPLRKRFLDNIYTLSMGVGTSPLGYTQGLLNVDSYNGTSFLYSYQNYCDMICAAFRRAFASLKIANPLLISTLPAMCTFNPITQLFNIVFPNTYITDNIKIYFNNALQWLFNYNAVRCTLDIYDALPINPLYPTINDYQVTLTGFRVLDTVYDYISQNFTTVSNLTDFKSFVIQTSMPITASQHGTSLNDIIVNNGSFSFIFCEIEIAGISQSGSVMWESNIPEFHHIQDSSSLKKIELNLFYSNTSDQLYPLPFELNYSASIQLIFRKVYNRVTVN
jgi:hypothetical protein